MLSDMDENLAFGPCTTSCNLNRSKSLGSLLAKPDRKLSHLKNRGSFREPKAPKLSYKPCIPKITKPSTNFKPSYNASKNTKNSENAPIKRVHNGVKDSQIASHTRLPLRTLNERWLPDKRSSTARQVIHKETPKMKKSTQNACDLAFQLKNLSNEHGKLMVTQATLRMQLMQSISFDRLSQLRRDHQCSLDPDMKLFSVPENSDTDAHLNPLEKQTQDQKTLAQNLESENARLQMENRKLIKLKTYCEKILNSESLGNELNTDNPQQDVILMEKVQSKENEVLISNEKVQELEKKLTEVTLELKECQDNLRSKQQSLDDLKCKKDDVSNKLLQCRSALKSASENIDFLHNERSSMAESLQESEKSLLATRAELVKEKDKYKHIAHRYQKMCDEMKQKDLSLQLLEAELDRAETTRQDILLKQSSERSMIHTELSQLSGIVQSILASAARFSLDELSIEKDMFEKIVSTFDNEVHSASECNPEAICDSDSIKNSVENMNDTNSELSDSNSSNKENTPLTPITFKPVGKATPFRSAKQQTISNDSTITEFFNTQDLKRASLKNELNKLILLINKCGAAAQFIQNKFISTVKSLNEEKNRSAVELRSFKYKHYELKADFEIRKHIIEKRSGKIAELSEELRKLKKNHDEEKEKLLQKIFKLNEEVHCLDAVNAEQSRQISNEVKHMISVVVESNNDFALAQALSDRLNYKQEITKLKAQLAEKEEILHQLAQKFKRTTASLEENWHDATKEINILDEVIKEAYIILKSNPELVEQNESLKKLFSLVCGKCSLADIDSLLNSKEDALCT